MLILRLLADVLGRCARNNREALDSSIEVAALGQTELEGEREGGGRRGLVDGLG